MRAVKRAKAQMHDTNFASGAIVAGRVYGCVCRTVHEVARLHQWARSAWRKIDLQHIATVEMGDLSDRTKMNTALSVLDEDTILYLRTADFAPIRYASHSDDHAPLHCTAAGKVFLAHMSTAQRDAILQDGVMRKFTDMLRVRTH